MPPRRASSRRRDPYRHVWDAENGGRRYRQHRETFLNTAYAVEQDPHELLYLWRLYVQYMVKGRGTGRRNDFRNPFWQELQIDPRDFDWDDWRTAMGYKRRAAA